MSKLLALAGTFAKSGCPFFKVDDEHGIAFGWAIISTIDGQPYFDTQGDHIPMSAVIKAAERFMKNSRAGDEQHDERRAGDIPFALPVDASIAKSLFGVDMPMEGLVIGFKPYNKALLGKIKSGERRGFSIGGVLRSASEVGKNLLGKSIMVSNGLELLSFAKSNATKKSTRRVFEDFEIDFISAVDWPAQEGALVAIVKSADGDDVEEPVLWMRKGVMPPKKPDDKTAAAPAMPGAMPAAKPTPGVGSPAGAPMQSGQMPGAMSQLAAQPVMPTSQQMPGAIAQHSLMAPNGGSLPIPPPKLTGESDGHQHAILLDEAGENGVGYTGFGISSVGVSHRHAFVMDPMGGVTIAVNDGHTHTPDGSDAAPELDEDGNPIEADPEDAPPPLGDGGTDEDSEDDGEGAMPPYSSSASSGTKPGARTTPGAPTSNAAPAANGTSSDASASDDKKDDSASGSKKPNPFTPRKRAYNSVQNSDDGVGLENKETEMTPEQIARLQKKLELAVRYGELNDEQKSFYKSLVPREQEEFLDQTSSQREERVKKAADADPVVYTTDDGIAIRKSDGKHAELMARRLDKQEKELASARIEKAALRYEKRADSELRHYPKSASVRGRILKAIETEFAFADAAKPTDIEKKAREEAMAVLKAGDVALSKSYTRSGVNADRGSDEVDDVDPEVELDKLAKKYAKENKISFHKAYDAVLKTEEGEALYNKAMGHDEFVGQGQSDDGDPEYDDLDGQGDDDDGRGAGGDDEDEEVETH